MDITLNQFLAGCATVSTILVAWIAIFQKRYQNKKASLDAGREKRELQRVELEKLKFEKDDRRSEEIKSFYMAALIRVKELEDKAIVDEKEIKRLRHWIRNLEQLIHSLVDLGLLGDVDVTTCEPDE